VLFFDAGKHWHALRLADGTEMQPAPAYLPLLESLQAERLHRLEFSPEGRLLAVGPRLVETATGAARPDPAMDTAALVTFDASGRLLVQHRDRSLVLSAPAGAGPPKRLELAREAMPRFSPDSSLLVAMGYQALEIFDT